MVKPSFGMGAFLLIVMKYKFSGALTCINTVLANYLAAYYNVVKTLRFREGIGVIRLVRQSLVIENSDVGIVSDLYKSLAVKTVNVGGEGSHFSDHLG